MKSIFISLVFILLCIGVHAQKLNVESFVAKTNDITARTQPRQDINGNDCALVKVQLAASNAVFEGNILGDVVYNTSEYLVYMAEGSKKLIVKLEGYLPLEVSFQDYDIRPLEPKTVYLLTISGVMNGREQEPIRTKTGWIILDSEPSGASVYINDEFVGNTPLNNYKQAYGNYSYKLEHPNYHSSSGMIKLNSSRYEDKIIMKPAFGTVAVKCNVDGAEVLLDGKLTGKRTPCKLEEIRSGQHVIEVRMNKYAPLQQDVMVEDDKTTKISVSLEARFAPITINSLEGAEIYCNGKRIGTGRCTEDIMEGYYDLEVRMDHYQSSTKQIQIIAGQAQELTIHPIPIYGSLDIITTPRDVTIMVDGIEYGKSPLTIDQLLEGEHQVTMVIDNYNIEKRTVNIRENKNSSIDVTLNRKNSVDNYASNDSENGQSIKEKGSGFDKAADNQETLRNNLLAAESGDTAAMNNLGKMYYEGLGVTRKYSEAFKWFKKSADLDNATACYYVGIMYANGEGVSKSSSRALKWFRKGAELGDENSKKLVAELETKRSSNTHASNTDSNFSLFGILQSLTGSSSRSSYNPYRAGYNSTRSNYNTTGNNNSTRSNYSSERTNTRSYSSDRSKTQSNYKSTRSNYNTTPNNSPTRSNYNSERVNTRSYSSDRSNNNSDRSKNNSTRLRITPQGLNNGQNRSSYNQSRNRHINSSRTR